MYYNNCYTGGNLYQKQVAVDSCRVDEGKIVLYLCQSSLFSPLTQDSPGSLKYIPVCVQFQIPGRGRTNSLSIIPNSPFWVLHLFENCSQSKWEASQRLQALSDCRALQVLVPAAVWRQGWIIHLVLGLVTLREASMTQISNCYYCYCSYCCGFTRININMNLIPKKTIVYFFFFSFSNLNSVHCC